MAQLTLAEVSALVQATLGRAGADAAMATSTAHSLVLAEAQGLGSHGLARVLQYASHLRSGRAVGTAQAEIVRRQGATLLVDAHQGLAFAACKLAIEQAIECAGQAGVCFAGVCNSHHAGVLVDQLRPAAAAGLVGLAFCNSPAAMPFAGGRRPIFGTNPLAAAFPRRHGDPLLIDLSLSEVARGKLMLAAREGRPIPLGWALDADGQPTTDPQAGLAGSMLPLGAAGSPKGALLALMVELLVTALIGSQFGFEANSFFVDEGNQPRIGQAFILIDPGALAGRDGYLERVEVLLSTILAEDGARLPGARREALLRKAQVEGLNLADSMLAQWRAI